MNSELASVIRRIKIEAWGRVIERARQKYPKEMEYRGVIGIALDTARELSQETDGAISYAWLGTFLTAQVDAMWDHVEAKLNDPKPPPVAPPAGTVYPSLAAAVARQKQIGQRLQAELDESIRANNEADSPAVSSAEFKARIDAIEQRLSAAAAGEWRVDGETLATFPGYSITHPTPDQAFKRSVIAYNIQLRDNALFIAAAPDDIRWLLEQIKQLATPADPEYDTVENFRRAWHEAMTGQTHPLSELWTDLDGD